MCDRRASSSLICDLEVPVSDIGYNVPGFTQSLQDESTDMRLRRTLQDSSVAVSSKPYSSFYTTNLMDCEPVTVLTAVCHTVQDDVAAVLASSLDQTPNVQRTVVVLCSPYWDST